MLHVDSKKFMKALNNLAEEKGIDKDIIFDAMELALTSAYKKIYQMLELILIEKLVILKFFLIKLLFLIRNLKKKMAR